SDGRRAVTETDGMVYIWDGARLVKDLKDHQGPHFSPYGDSVLCHQKKQIAVWDVSNPNDPKLGEKLRQAVADIEELILSPDRRMIATLQGEYRLVRV